MLSFFLSSFLFLITQLSPLRHLSLLTEAHCQGFIKTTSLQGLCPCVLEEKKHNNLNHSRRVLWLLHPTDTTQLAAFFLLNVPKQALPGSKGEVTLKKKYILTKTCPSRDNNHINNSPRGSRICQKPAEKNEKSKKKHTHSCAVPSECRSTKPQLQANLYEVKYISNLIPKSNLNKWDACGLVWMEAARYLLKKNREKGTEMNKKYSYQKQWIYFSKPVWNH